LGWYEQHNVATSEFNDFVENWPNIAVYEPLDYENLDKKRASRLVKHAPIIDLTLAEMRSSLYVEDGTDDLLERLTVSSLLAHKGAKTAGAEELGQKMIKRWYKEYGAMEEPEVKPVSDKLFYHYDYGDGWVVEITRIEDCSDLIKNGALTEEELAEAQYTVIEKYKPVCIHQDGMRLVDDVGGLGGFIDMLRRLYESAEPDGPHDPYDTGTKENTRAWAHGMGWSARKISNRQML
jgi:hypothetical protein